MTENFPNPICPFHGNMGIKMIQKSKYHDLRESLNDSIWITTYECPACFFIAKFHRPMTTSEIQKALNPYDLDYLKGK